jgi:predicted ribosome quality control (RQC) complex YloA/Tae2 family protein
MAIFREYKSKQGTTFLAGKSSETNELLISQVEKDEDVLHTVRPGSPFVNIKGKTKKGDLKEAALFCAVYSQDWKKNKKDVAVHVFKGKDIFKEKPMKEGTFGVKKFKEIKVKKSEIEKFVLRKNAPNS